MSNATVKGELVLEYLRKYPSFPSRKLASLIMSATPGVFKDLEDCRSVVRYYRGAKGLKDRSKLEPETYVPRVIVEQSDSVEWLPLELSAKDFPLIAGGDAHVPYHDQDILEMFIEQAVEIGAKTVLLMGDWWDCFYLSKFLTDPRKRHTEGEIEIVKKVLKTIRDALPNARIIYKLGNHEERLEHYLMRLAPEVFGLKSMTFENILGLKELNIELVKDQRLIKYNKLFFLHGHEYRGGISNPVNPARTLFLKAKRSAIEWHFHQAQSHSGRAINDDVTTCWSGGCMCELHPEYARLNEWSHGFVEVYVDETGFWSVVNRKIVNYRYC